MEPITEPDASVYGSDIYGGCPHGMAGRPYCGTCLGADLEIARLRRERDELRSEVERLRAALGR